MHSRLPADGSDQDIGGQNQIALAYHECQIYRAMDAPRAFFWGTEFPYWQGAMLQLMGRLPEIKLSEQKGFMPYLAGDYFVMVFVAALGVIQMAAAYSHLNGLLFVQHRTIAGLVGLAMIVGAFTWFFASEPRNLPDTGGGLDANDQSTLFAVGATTALVVTLITSSLLNSRIALNSHLERSGLDVLQTTTYGRAFLGSIRALRRMWRQWTRKLSSG